MHELPLALPAFFLLTCLLGLWFFWRVTGRSKVVMAGVLAWLAAQSALALAGFFRVTNAVPPRLLLALAPPLGVIAGLFLTAAGRKTVDAMVLKWCLLLHSIRMLVEITLYWLFLYKQVPKLMTFEGGNLDIVAGVTAPLVWCAYSKGELRRGTLLIWNGLALVSVLNTVARAILSAPFRFQRFAFDQPTVAVLSFPFILLPAFLVPAVILCHLAVFRKLTGARVKA